MRVIVTEFVANATCDVSGKTGECVRATLEPNAPLATMLPSEFIKLLRFQSQQEAKRAAQPAPPVPSRERPVQNNP
jgi:hypothetical protein